MPIHSQSNHVVNLEGQSFADEFLKDKSYTKA